jgi:rare lipoprotein A (peptidoglycan hydrolase)
MKKLVAALTVLCIFSTLFPAYANPPTSTVPTSTTIEEKTKEIEELKRELTSLEKEIEDLNGRKISLKNWVEVYNARVAEASLEVEAANEALEKQKKIIAQRIRNIYKLGERRYLEVLLGSKTFLELLENIVFLPRIVEQDKKVLEKLKERKNEVEKKKRKLEEIRDTQSHLLVEYQKTLNELLDKRNRLNELLSQASDELRLLIEEEQRRYQESFKSAQKNSYLGEVNTAVAFVEPYSGQAFLTSERFPKRYRATGEVYTLVTSWYGPGFHGRTTSSGEIFNQEDFTCAHPTFPFGTYLAVTYKDKSIIVKVNDRGPFIPGRSLDLSKKAAETLGILSSGVATVKVEIVKPLP